MRARQALNPGRIKLTFEDGSTKYAVMERADNPVVEGDPLNPYTLLKDETCTMLGGNPETMVPDDAFQMLAALAASGGGNGDVGDLEDTAFEVGMFVNSGCSWNTFKFREALRRCTADRLSGGGLRRHRAGEKHHGGRVSVLSADAFHRQLLHRRLVRIDAVA